MIYLIRLKTEGIDLLKSQIIVLNKNQLSEFNRLTT